MTADLEYTAQSERDYGTLACWAANEVGRQAEPCVFRVVQASEYRRAMIFGPHSLAVFADTP